jgi:NADPH-dependent ferric siderophore reductase
MSESAAGIQMTERFGKRPMQRQLSVHQSVRLTPNMQRITLGGHEIADLPGDQSTAYVKLAFSGRSASPGSFAARVRSLVRRERPVLRSYTIRRQDTARNTFDIDFVLHDEGGPASDWARTAQPGDRVQVMGPGPRKLVDSSADWFLLAGDMSALPAIAGNVALLPPTARGHVVIELMEDGDRQDLEAPEGVSVQWIVNPHPNRPNTMLLDAVRALPWLEGRPAIWVAGELDAMRQIRSYVRTERDVPRSSLYASSYWQMGRTDEQHRREKARDRD